MTAVDVDLPAPWAGRVRWRFPDGDRDYVRGAFREVPETIDMLLSLCPRHGLAVQAGGFVGIWPARLAQSFERVLTFESHRRNFGCLRRNLAGVANVEMQRGALGDGSPVKVHRSRTGNGGGHHVLPHAGGQPSIRIDDLGLDTCDLIQLDIEGMELEALRGARETVAKHHPVICIEQKRLRHVERAHDLAEIHLAEEHGYRRAAAIGLDVIMVPPC